MRMQLNCHRSIRRALATATASLIGASPLQAAGAGHSETSVLLYSERDRIRATEIVYSLQRSLNNGDRLSLRLTYDGLTGASPTGGSPSKQAQTVTRPSGGSTVVVPAGQIPRDENFSDTRFAAQFGLARRLSLNTEAMVGISGSSEHDYKSLGLNGGLVFDFHDLKSSIGVAGSFNHDSYNPNGGVPTAYAPTDTVMDNDNGRLLGNGARPKDQYDLALSYSKVMSTRTLARWNLSINHAEGYLTDPYKQISVVQPIDSADAGEPVGHLFEKRPNRRTGIAGAFDLRSHVAGTIAQTGYRYYRDDWGVQSHTADLSVKLQLSATKSLEPRARWYRQSRADFSRPFLVQGQPRPEYASADARLATFTAFTYGLAYSFPSGKQSSLTFSAEYYLQSGDQSPPEAFGPLTTFSLFPNIRALMLRVSLGHDII